MNKFSETDIALMHCIGEQCMSNDANTIWLLRRGTLSLTCTQREDGGVKVFCADNEYAIQTTCDAQTLEDAIRQAFSQYREKSSAVRQTRQFISNAEDDIRKHMEMK